MCKLLPAIPIKILRVRALNREKAGHSHLAIPNCAMLLQERCERSLRETGGHDSVLAVFYALGADLSEPGSHILLKFYRGDLLTNRR